MLCAEYHKGGIKHMAKWRPNIKTRPDTRRTTWKQFGGHNGGKYIGSGNGSGKYYKKLLHKAERAYWKQYIKAFLSIMHLDDAPDPNVTDRYWRHAKTEEDWMGW